MSLFIVKNCNYKCFLFSSNVTNAITSRYTDILAIRPGSTNGIQLTQTVRTNNAFSTRCCRVRWTTLRISGRAVSMDMSTITEYSRVPQ